MKVLVTGFGPFPGVPENRSALVVRGLAASPALRGHEIHGEVLPTTYEDSERLIAEWIALLKPDICICLGVAPTPAIRLERVACNATATCAPDAMGRIREGAIVDGGPATHESSLPLAAIEQELLRHGFPVEWSDDAGSYVCNHTFYRACETVRGHGLATACGFIHIPRDETPMADGSPLSVPRLVEALNLAIGVAILGRG